MTIKAFMRCHPSNYMLVAQQYNTLGKTFNYIVKVKPAGKHLSSEVPQPTICPLGMSFVDLFIDAFWRSKTIANTVSSNSCHHIQRKTINGNHQKSQDQMTTKAFMRCHPSNYMIICWWLGNIIHQVKHLTTLLILNIRNKTKKHLYLSAHYMSVG